jgi:hypothetical protein
VTASYPVWACGTPPLHVARRRSVLPLQYEVFQSPARAFRPRAEYEDTVRKSEEPPREGMKPLGSTLSERSQRAVVPKVSDPLGLIELRWVHANLAVVTAVLGFRVLVPLVVAAVRLPLRGERPETHRKQSPQTRSHPVSAWRPPSTHEHDHATFRPTRIGTFRVANEVTFASGPPARPERECSHVHRWWCNRRDPCHRRHRASLAARLRTYCRRLPQSGECRDRPRLETTEHSSSRHQP